MTSKYCARVRKRCLDLSDNQFIKCNVDALGVAPLNMSSNVGDAVIHKCNVERLDLWFKCEGSVEGSGFDEAPSRFGERAAFNFVAISCQVDFLLAHEHPLTSRECESVRFVNGSGRFSRSEAIANSCGGLLSDPVTAFLRLGSGV